MPAYYGGVIFLIAKFFTAFTDMLTGFLLDSQKHWNQRKFRPFILYAAVPSAIIATVQFIATTFSLPIKTAIATGLFMLFGLFYSLMNCSYGAMIPAITKIQMNAHNWQLSGREGNNRIINLYGCFYSTSIFILYNYHWLWLCSLNFLYLWFHFYYVML